MLIFWSCLCLGCICHDALSLNMSVYNSTEQGYSLTQPGGSVVKNPPASSGDGRDMGSISRLGRSPGEGNGNPLQYSCLENPMDRGAWQATVHGVTKRQAHDRYTQCHRTRIFPYTTTSQLTNSGYLPLMEYFYLIELMYQFCQVFSLFFWRGPYFPPSYIEPLMAQMVKHLPAMRETWVRFLGWDDSPGGGNGNPLQYSCLENSMDGGAW